MTRAITCLKKAAVVLAATLVLTGAMLAAPADNDAKIDKDLFEKFLESDSGSIPFFLVFSQKADLSAASKIKDWAARGRYVANALQATAKSSQAAVRKLLDAEKVPYTSFWGENKIYIHSGNLELARDLADMVDISVLIPEHTFSLPRPKKSAATSLPLNWNIAQIEADKVWSTYGNQGTGIVVANIDTGVQYNHPALVQQYRGNLGAGVFNHAGNFYDPTTVCGRSGTPCDEVGHGSHTMGTMVGDDHAGNQIGVAPGAKWIACKACTTQGCASSYLISCAQWILAPDGDPAKRPNIVNNSWGGPGTNSFYQSYVQNWIAAGIFPAFSAGNDGPGCNTINSPGDYPESYTSGATDSSDTIASFSSRGSSLFGVLKPDVSAPGVSIYSSVPPNAYQLYDGTSMASPHTAGTVALLWANRPSYLGNVAATEKLINSNMGLLLTTTETCGGLPSGAQPNDTYGNGRLDAKRTVDAGVVAPPAPPVLTITSPATAGKQFTCGTPVIFSGTATDAVDGDITSKIQWSGAGTPASPTGGSVVKTFNCTTEVGNNTIGALVTDSLGLKSNQSVGIIVVNPAPPAAPKSLTASVSGKTVNLAWVDQATNAVGYQVYRRVSLGGGKWSAWVLRQTIANPSAASYSDSSLTSSTYQYYVNAYNSGGNSAQSNTVSAVVK